FGVDVFVRRVFWEMAPYMETEFLTKNRSGLAGLRGPLGARWRYEFAAQYQETRYQPTGLGANTTFGGTTAVNAAINNPDPFFRPILLNDGLTTSPNSEEVLRAMLVDRSYREQPS